MEVNHPPRFRRRSTGAADTWTGVLDRVVRLRERAQHACAFPVSKAAARPRARRLLLVRGSMRLVRSRPSARCYANHRGGFGAGARSSGDRHARPLAGCAADSASGSSDCHRGPRDGRPHASAHGPARVLHLEVVQHASSGEQTEQRVSTKHHRGQSDEGDDGKRSSEFHSFCPRTVTESVAGQSGAQETPATNWWVRSSWPRTRSTSASYSRITISSCSSA